MKKFLLLLFAGVIFTTMFAGCERNDYQHPLHRANKSK
jgi:hypothetical protein